MTNELMRGITIIGLPLAVLCGAFAVEHLVRLLALLVQDDPDDVKRRQQ
jgi:hypothetical protein